MEHIQAVWAPESIPWLQFNLSTTIMIVVTAVVVLILSLYATRKLTAGVPTGIQNFFEWIVDFVSGFIGSTIGQKNGRKFIYLGLTLILFIFVGNMLGLPFNFITIHDEPLTILGSEIITEQMLLDSEVIHNGEKVVEIAWWKSPTADISVTMALALSVILLTHILGVIYKGWKGYFKHYFEPYKVWLPLNLLDEAVKFLTLAMRLYGNIFAGEMLIGLLVGLGLFGIIPLIVWQAFSIFVGSIQAFIFTILTMVYISQKISTDH